MSYEDTKDIFLKGMDFLITIGGRLYLSPIEMRSREQRVANIVCFLVLFTFAQLLITLFLTGFGEWLEIISIAPNAGACLTSIVKLTTIMNNKALYDKIHNHFRNDLWDLIPFHPSENIKTFEKYTNYTIMVGKFLTTFASMLTVLVDSFPWLLMNFESHVLGRDSSYLYPIDAWYPFDKVKWYWVAYIWESLMTAAVILLYMFGNVTNITYVSFICMELSILGNCVENLLSVEDINNIKANINLTATHKVIKNKLKFIIKRYNFLHEITVEMDKAMGNEMLLAYVFDAIFICLTAFSFTVIDDLFKSIRYFSFFLSLLIELFNLCIMGQLLIDHSGALSVKIFCSDWIYANTETKKIILMLLLRTRRPFKLTANKFVVMNLNTYSQICSSSYQLFNLLHTMYKP